jgi:hypothetical protein
VWGAFSKKCVFDASMKRVERLQLVVFCITQNIWHKILYRRGIETVERKNLQRFSSFFLYIIVGLEFMLYTKSRFWVCFL